MRHLSFRRAILVIILGAVMIAGAWQCRQHNRKFMQIRSNTTQTKVIVKCLGYAAGEYREHFGKPPTTLDDLTNWIKSVPDNDRRNKWLWCEDAYRSDLTRMTMEAGLDGWGHRLKMVFNGKQVKIISAGQDGIFSELPDYTDGMGPEDDFSWSG